MKIVSWFSAGVSSAVATKLAIDKYGKIDIYYTHIDDQHEDTMRFVSDCEKWYGCEINILQSELKSVNNACLKASFINSPHGAPCSRLLKRRVRQEFEQDFNEQYRYIWGFDLSEKDRSYRIIDSTPEHEHEFPLINRGIDKADAHGILDKAGIKRPIMYDLGYPNNNCIGCVKGGMGYWNKIRIDFPEVFHRRIELEDTIGGRIFKEFRLKDLPTDAGRKLKIIVPDCGLFCETMMEG